MESTHSQSCATAFAWFHREPFQKFPGNRKHVNPAKINVGEPMVGSPDDTFNMICGSDLQKLAMGNVSEFQVCAAKREFASVKSESVFHVYGLFIMTRFTFHQIREGSML